MMDRRRSPYIAVDVWLLFSNTTERLLSEFGAAGVVAWVGLLAAVKRAPVYGVLSCVNEEDFWNQVGLPAEHRGNMTMNTLLTVLGHLKQTSRTRSGRRINVRISHFEAWQQAPKSFREAERMRRKRAEKTANDTATIDENTANDTATETRQDKTTACLPLPVDEGADRGETPPQQAAAPRTNGRRPHQEPAYPTTEHHKHYRPDKAAQYAANVGHTLTPTELATDLTREFTGIPAIIAHQLAHQHAGTPEPPPAAPWDNPDTTTR